MFIDETVLAACLTGVLVERGTPIDAAKAMVNDLREPPADLQKLIREVSSVILTMNAHGMIVRDKPALSPAKVLTILTDSAAQTDRAAPVSAVNNQECPAEWHSPGEEWWESFTDCVEAQLTEE